MPSVRPLVIWYIFLTLILLWLWQDAIRQVALRTIPYSEFKARLAGGEVSECTVEQDEITGKVTPKPATSAARAQGGRRAGRAVHVSECPHRGSEAVETCRRRRVEFSGVRRESYRSSSGHGCADRL